MANLRGVDISTGKIGANTLGGNDGIAGLVIASPVATGLAHDVVTTVFNLKDVENLGITAAFDKANFINCYRHFREHFRNAGEGNKTYAMLVPQATTMVSMLTDSAVNADDAKAKKLLIQADGEIRLVGLASNPTAAPVLLNGMNADSYNALAKAHGLTVWADQKDMPINVFVEGRDYSGTAATAASLRELPHLNARHTTLLIGQDWKYADTLPSDNGAATSVPVYMRNFADVGTALGIAARAAVNQSIGENERFNLTDASKDAWMVAGLSNHQKIKDQFSDLQTKAMFLASLIQDLKG